MKKIFLYTLATALIWGVTGCQKPSDFGNTNVNPAAITTPIPSAILATVEVNLTSYSSTGVYALYGAQYGQYFAETQYPSVSTYVLPQVSFGDYSGNLLNLQTIITAAPSKNMVAIANIMQQYIYWHMTDCFGDIPYSQALKGLAFISPAYDKQQDIYPAMLSTITSAVQSMDGSAITGDLIYGNDPVKWKKFGNSLRMLIALQLSKKQPGATDYAATQFKAALSDAAGDTYSLSSQTGADDAKLVYPTGSSYKDPFFNLYDGRTDYAESSTLTAILGTTSDTRATVYGGAFNDPNNVTGGTVSSNVGLPPGADRATTLAFTTANPNFALVLRADKRTPTSAAYIITASESLLARAEAAFLGWTTESASAQYTAGITASYAQWGLGTPSTSFLGNVHSAAPAYADIIQQRYVASYPDGFMAWDIYRKTSTTRDGGTTGTAFANNPLNIKPGSGAVNTPKLIVSRFTYATSEYTTNKANVTAAAARYTSTYGTGDKQDSRVWWDF